jgi:hypothetical protein
MSNLFPDLAASPVKAPQSRLVIRAASDGTHGSPIFACSIRNSTQSDMICRDSEVLIESGLQRCDLFLPAHDVLKLGLSPFSTVITLKPIQGPAIRARQFSHAYLEFVFVDEDGKEHSRGCDLEVWTRDEEYTALASTRESAKPSADGAQVLSAKDSSATSESESVSNINPMPPLSPIKFVRGSSKRKPCLGLGGMRKLNLLYDSGHNHMSLVDTAAI